MSSPANRRTLLRLLHFLRPYRLRVALAGCALLIASGSVLLLGHGLKRVIDISGDGPNNQGGSVTDVRDQTIATGVTINGLPLMMKANQNSWQAMLQLDHYYEDCVIGGPGAFLVIARDFEDFARAIRRKLILEIAGLTPPPAPRIWRAQLEPSERIRQSPGGYTYPKGCDIGERMREGYWADDDT